MQNNSSIRKTLEQYIDKITGFAYLKTGSQQEAEDLAQDICVEVLKTLNRGREPENLGAYIWTVSQNVFSRWVRSIKRSTYVELTGLEADEDCSLSMLLDEEDANLLRREISYLSSLYRQIIVLHYFDGKSCAEIAQIKDVKVGTVKWWLFEARNQLKKGMEIMRPNGEKSFKPGKLNVGISGSTGRSWEPFNLVNDNLLAQNILLAAYEKPINEEMLAQELGVARPYIESEIIRLVNGQLLKRLDDQTYQTDFVISNSIIGQENNCALELGFDVVKAEVIGFIENEWDFFEDDTINVAGFSRERLWWVTVPMVMDLIHREVFGKLAEPAPVPERPNGGRWIALGSDGSPRDTEASCSDSFNPNRYGYNGPLCSYFNNGKYGARILYHWWNGYGCQAFDMDVMDDANNTNNNLILVCRDLAKGKLDITKLNEKEISDMSEAIKWGLVIKDGEKLKPNFVFVPKERLENFQRCCGELGERLSPVLGEIIKKLRNNIRAHSPKAVWWQINNFLGADFGCLTPMLLDELYKAGRLSAPPEQHKHLLSFYIWG